MIFLKTGYMASCKLYYYFCYVMNLFCFILILFMYFFTDIVSLFINTFPVLRGHFI